MERQSPSARTMRPSSQRKHLAIITAAADAFLAVGFANANLDDIAAAAGVSKATVYAHFESKEGLLVAVVRARTATAADRVDAALARAADTADPRARLESIASALLEAVLEPQMMRLRRLIIAEQPRQPALAQAFWEGGAARVIGRLEGVLRELHDRGALHVPDPAGSASAANWLILGEPLNAAMLRGESSLPDSRARAALAARSAALLVAAHSLP